jgi:hypothetical protein
MKIQLSLIPIERIQRTIYLVRGEKVMLDRDLALLYGVSTGNLNKAVKRNLNRFPSDFMLQLTPEETEALRFQFGSLRRGQHFKYLPFAFTEQGVAMLSTVLRSDRAVQVNIAIMRAFVQLRSMLGGHVELARKLCEPSDFAFHLTPTEKSGRKRDHLRRLRFLPVLPRAFTEHGAIMAANVLNSPRAVQMSVFVVRAFVKMRGVLGDTRALTLKRRPSKRK